LLQDLASRGVKMPNSIVVGSTATGAQEQSATSPGSAPEASATLKRFHDHISDATELDFDTKVLVQRKFGEGTTQAMATFLTRRPNLFRIHAEVKGRKYVVISDGWTVTIYRPGLNRYAQYPASRNMLSTLYTVTGLTNISGRLLDFFWASDPKIIVAVSDIE